MLSSNEEDEEVKAGHMGSSMGLLAAKVGGYPNPPPTEDEEDMEKEPLPDPPPLPDNEEWGEITPQMRAAMMSTTSVNYLVDGLRSVAPFEKEVVDCRDSLLNVVVRKSGKVYEWRVKEAGRMIKGVAQLTAHILKMGEDGEHLLIGLSPMGIIKNPKDVFVIVFHQYLLDQGELEQGREVFNKELGRWKAPEILRGEEEKETEKSCVYTIMSIAHTMILEEKPFDEFGDVEAMEQIMAGERPDVKELKEKKCVLYDLMEMCWFDEPEERLELEDVRLEAEQIRYDSKEEKEEDDDDEDNTRSGWGPADEEEEEEEKPDDDDDGEKKS
jgi:hypothetical protein